MMIIHKITFSVDYNQWLIHLDTQLNEPTNQYSIKVSKVDKPTNKKTLGTSKINSPMSPSTLIRITYRKVMGGGLCKNSGYKVLLTRFLIRWLLWILNSLCEKLSTNNFNLQKG